MNKLTWGSLVTGSLCLIMLSPNVAAQTFTEQCRTGTVCYPEPDGTRTCSQTTHCWWTKFWSGFTYTYTYPDGGASGIDVPFLPLDQQPDAVMDCWKGVTDNADLSSPFPVRYEGGPHDGIDVTSGTDNYGRGAPIRSLGTGIVSEVDGTNPNGPNGNFIRVDQGDGIQMTYIHLLDFQTADGSVLVQGDQVMVNEQMARMNCTGDCGGASGPERGHISKTHVHIQARRMSDGVLVDPRYGGENCSLDSGSGGGGSGGGGGGPGGGTGACTGFMCTTEP